MISRLQFKLLTGVEVDRAECRAEAPGAQACPWVCCISLWEIQVEIELVAEFYGPEELYILAIVEVCN